MPEWRALGCGLGVFLGALAMVFTGSEGVLFLAGVPTGFVTGYAVGGLSRGLWYGFVIGIGIAILVIGGTLSLANTGRPAPGVGIAIVFMNLVAVLLLVESVIAGAIGGYMAA